MKMTAKLILPLAAAFTLAWSGTVWAATEIGSVSIRIDSGISAGDSDSEVSVTTSSSAYEVDEVKVTNTPGKGWEDGDTPKLKITLSASGKYDFKSGFSKGNVYLSGDRGTVTKVSRSEDELKVYVTLEELGMDENYKSYNLGVTDLVWDESSGVGLWEGDDDAKRYEVCLYRGGSAVTSTLTTTSTKYNFSSYLTVEGNYRFRVRPVRNSVTRGSWEESDTWHVSSELASVFAAASAAANTGSSDSGSSAGPAGSSPAAGTWISDSVGRWYRNADQSYTVNNWQFIDNRWYFFDETGYMKTGWIPWNSKWYYCGADGAMLANTTTPDGYYVGSDGAWIQ